MATTTEALLLKISLSVIGVLVMALITVGGFLYKDVTNDIKDLRAVQRGIELNVHTLGIYLKVPQNSLVTPSAMGSVVARPRLGIVPN